ncbi:MAG: hypothetical protein ACO1SV_12590 [Fimbriimonas sp.]
MKKTFSEPGRVMEAGLSSAIARRLQTRLGHTPIPAVSELEKAPGQATLVKVLGGVFASLNRVVSPAMAGTTVAWMAVAASYQIASQYRLWMPATGELVEMWLCTFLTALALSQWRRLKPVRASMLATGLGSSLALSVSYGRFQRSTWPWPEFAPSALDFAASSFLAFLLGIVTMGIAWVPVVIASSRRYRTLNQELKETQGNA